MSRYRHQGTMECIVTRWFVHGKFAFLLLCIANVARAEPPSMSYQFGIGMAVRFATRSSFCRDDASCVLGSGAGVVAMMGVRRTEHWYFGGAYEFTKHNAATLLRLGIMQHLRADFRYYIPLADDWGAHLGASPGFIAYGNEWSIQTWGAGLQLRGAVDRRVGGTLLGMGLLWQTAFLREMADPSRPNETDAAYAAGFVNFFGIELHIEALERL